MAATSENGGQAAEVRCHVGDLTPGDEIEMYVIASNDGWEWVSAVVLDTNPFRVRWWDGDEKAWLRESARIPSIRRKPVPFDKTPPRGALPPDVQSAARRISRRVWGDDYTPGEGTMHHAGGPYWRNQLLMLADSWERDAEAARRCAEVLPDA